MVKIEESAAKDLDLPSIGIEVEVPLKLFPREYDFGNEVLPPPVVAAKDDYLHMIKFLERIDFGLSSEHRSTEFRFPPSNSAEVQTRMLYELRKLGFIPTDSQFASLHISLGIPWGGDPFNAFGDNTKNYNDREKLLVTISDLMTYAFVPAGRVRSREYSEDAVAVWPVEGVVNNIKYQAEDMKVCRAEFRTGRVHGPKTYRLLKELQRLGVLAISKDKKLRFAKDKLIEDVSGLLNKYNLQNNLPATNQEKAADAIANAWQIKLRNKSTGEYTPNLIDDARDLMKSYSLMVARSRKQKS